MADDDFVDTMPKLTNIAGGPTPEDNSEGGMHRPMVCFFSIIVVAFCGLLLFKFFSSRSNNAIDHDTDEESHNHLRHNNITTNITGDSNFTTNTNEPEGA
ncbi:MAG: hypothetical protein RLN62_04175 [Rickettsiales bacterium]